MKFLLRTTAPLLSPATATRCALAARCAIAVWALVTPLALAQDSPAAASTKAQQAAAALPDVEAGIRRIISDHHGSVALFAQQLNTGKQVALDADKPVQTASTIKLALLWTLLRDVALGHAQWSEPMTLHAGEAVAGAGLLHFLDAPVTLTLKDVATMMVILSDNTATNLLLDRFPTAEVNANVNALGQRNTWFYKKISVPATRPMPADQPKFGLGKTTPREIASVMERIGRCDLNLPSQPPVDQAKADAACKVALDMLRSQFYRDTIPRYLDGLNNTEAGSGIASKTGSLNATRSDVALIAAKSGPIVLAVYTYDNADQGWSVDNEGEVTIAKIAKAIVMAWSLEGIDGKQLLPGLGLRGAMASLATTTADAAAAQGQR